MKKMSRRKNDLRAILGSVADSQSGAAQAGQQSACTDQFVNPPRALRAGLATRLSARTRASRAAAKYFGTVPLTCRVYRPFTVQFSSVTPTTFTRGGGGNRDDLRAFAKSA